jgi:hypothetical protein
VHTTGSRPRLVVSADGRGVVSHAGSRLLADLADATGLTTAFTDALRQLRPRGTGHAPGRIAVDLAVMRTRRFRSAATPSGDNRSTQKLTNRPLSGRLEMVYAGR